MDREEQGERRRSEGSEPGRRAVALGVLCALVALAGVLVVGSRVGRNAAQIEEWRPGQSIVIAGVRVPIGTPVVLWTDPGGHDASAEHREDRPEIVLPSGPAPGCNVPARIGERSFKPQTIDDLRARIDLFVIHYDESWTSKNCFHVLQDDRGLSVQFLCDLDGTIYQTCDVLMKCRHAREANDRSVGVEIAHPGAFGDDKRIPGAYRQDERGVYLELPAPFAGQERTPGFVPRPARQEPISGPVQGGVRRQYDYTEEQYRALARLAAGLSRALPRIRLEAPRDAAGIVVTHALPPAESGAFEGVLGHFHLTTDKTDPGPAFDWERFLREARALRDE